MHPIELTEQQYQELEKDLAREKDNPNIYPNGTFVYKTNSEKDDDHKDGDCAEVTGSIEKTIDSKEYIMYRVKWFSDGIESFVASFCITDKEPKI
jgi:hypothetical protein